MAVILSLTFIFATALLNLVLGYVTAALLGMGPRTLTDIRRALGGKRTSNAETTETISNQTGDAESQAAEVPPSDCSIISSCRVLSTELFRYSCELGDVDALGRELAQTLSTDTLSSLANRLIGGVHLHLENVCGVVDMLGQLEGGNALRQGRAQLQACADLANVDLNGALSTLTRFTDHEDLDDETLELGLAKLIEGMTLIRDRARQTRNHMEAAISSLLQCDDLEEAIPIDLQKDAQFPLLSRIGWQMEVEKLQAAKTQVCVAIFDYDHFGGVVNKYGVHTSDGMLQHFATRLEQECEDGRTAARISGTRFLLLSPKTEPTEMANVVERVRQSIEQTHFMVDQGQIVCTTSAAYCEISPEMAWEDYFDQLETGLDEAKSYGRNRTFMCEEGHNVPLTPLELKIEARDVRLAAA